MIYWILFPKAKEGFIELNQRQVNNPWLEATYYLYPCSYSKLAPFLHFSLETCKQQMLVVAFALQDFNNHEYMLASGRVNDSLHILKNYTPTIGSGDPNWKRKYPYKVNTWEIVYS